MDKDIFSLVSRPEEKIKLWQDLAQAKAEIICKGHADSLCKVKAALYLSSLQILECQFQGSPLSPQEEYLGYFFIGGEKYYFKAKAALHEGKLRIGIPAELWHLQRRQNYRVKIPSGFAATYDIAEVNGAPQKIAGKLADLSSQGCRVVYQLKNPLMKVGDAVIGNLQIDNKTPFAVQGLVRHIKVDEGNQFIQTFGIEFTPLDAITENKLFAITMEIHKRYFKSW